MAKATQQANPLQGLMALAQFVEALTPQATPAEKPARQFTGAREGYRSVAVISEEEAKAILAAAKSGKDETVTVGNRETVVEVLDAEAAAKFKGGYRIHRRTLPTS